MEKNFTKGSILRALVAFSIPYLLSCFLQTFYGMADLYVTGQYNGAAAISAVSIGSQVMHMITVVIVGLAMGTTVLLGQAVGEKNKGKAGKLVGNTVVLFLAVSLISTGILLLVIQQIMEWVSVPKEALGQTREYLTICFLGIPIITAYNILSCIFRGMGDSKSPMYFVAAACVLNILLDFAFIGGLHMGAAGAAWGTVLSQTASVVGISCYKEEKRNDAKAEKAGFCSRSTDSWQYFENRSSGCLPGRIYSDFLSSDYSYCQSERRGSCRWSGDCGKGYQFSFFSAICHAVFYFSHCSTEYWGRKARAAEKTLGYGLVLSVSFGILAAGACILVPGGGFKTFFSG